MLTAATHLIFTSKARSRPCSTYLCFSSISFESIVQLVSIVQAEAKETGYRTICWHT